MKSGKALIAAHCENRVGGGLVDFGLFAEEPTMPVEKVAPSLMKRVDGKIYYGATSGKLGSQRV